MTEPTPTEVQPLDRSLPMALTRARETAMRFFRPLLAEHDLTEQQWRVLRALAASPTALEVGELAAATCLLGPSLTRILVRLVDRGLVARTVPDHDQRRGVLSLTPAGHDLVAAVAPGSERRDATIEERFGRANLDRLLALLDDLAAIDPNDRPDDRRPDRPTAEDDPRHDEQQRRQDEQETLARWH